MQAESDIIKEREQEKHAQHQPEIDQHGHILGKQEQILGHIDLGEDFCIGHEGAHAPLGGFPEKGHDDVAGKQVGGKMRGISAKQLGKHQLHHQQGKKWRQNAPPHPQNRALIFLLEIPFDQFLKEELVFFNLLQHLLITLYS